MTSDRETNDRETNDRNFVEKRFNDPTEYRAAVMYVSSVVVVAAIGFAVYAFGSRDSVFSAALVPAFLFAGGVGALVRTYRRWKTGHSWTAWQGAGWFLLLLMLVALAVPGSAAFAT